MIPENIIIPVNKLTDWIKMIVVVPQSNRDITTYPDFRILNKYVKRKFLRNTT